MDKKTLFEILKQNGVKFNTAILDEEVDGYASDENEAYSQTLYDDLFLLAQYGMQNGFKSVSKKILQLTDYIAKLLNGTKYKSVNLAKMETERSKLMGSPAKVKEGINMDMKDVVLQNLNDCIKVTESILSFRSDNQTLCGRLNESKEILLQIRAELENVSDVMSKQAGEYQVDVFNILLDWRADVGLYQCFTENVESLRGALAKVKEWSKLTKAVSFWNKAKAGEDFYDTYNPQVDDIYGIIKGSSYAERTDALRTSVAEYREHTRKLNDVEGMRADLAALKNEHAAETDRINASITAINNEMKEVIVAGMNGELDQATVDRRCTAYEDQIADYQSELAEVNEDFNSRIIELNEEIQFAGSDTRIRDDLAREFDKVIKRLENYRTTDPAKFTLFCSRIDFTTMLKMLSGRASQESVSELYTSIQAITSVVEEEIRVHRMNAAQLTYIRRDARRVAQEQLIADKEDEALNNPNVHTTRTRNTAAVNTNQAADDEARRRNAERAARLGLNVSPAPQENQQQQTEQRSAIDDIIPIGNDDL
ncbi:MAG: hypothetical protein ACI4VK_04535 [Candidatus Coproplasma sp.]